MRRPSDFKRTAVTRAMKAVQAAGLAIVRVEISKDGAIVVVTGEPTKSNGSDNEAEEWIRQHEVHA